MTILQTTIGLFASQGKISPTLGVFTVPDHGTGDAPFTLTPPTSNSPGTWTFTSSDPTVLSISSSTATVGVVGTATVTATQAASGNFLEAVVTYTTNVIVPAYGLFGFGANTTGVLGIGNIVSKSSPVQTGSLTTWTSLSASNFLLGISSSGALWSCGSNSNGQLGVGSLVSKSSPVQVGALTNWKQVSAGNLNTAAAIKTDGTLWTWGYNQYGQLGIGTSGTGSDRTSPVKVGALTTWKSVSAANYNMVAIKTDGTLWAWGDSQYGQLAGATSIKSAPIQIGILTTWSQASYGGGSMMAIKTDGTLWTWGQNTNGVLGQSFTGSNRSAPVQVGALTNWKTVYSGTQAAAIKTDGTLWTWGANISGQLGLGDVSPRSSPVQVGSFTNWTNVANGSSHMAALRADGTLWTWGANNSGQLGLGDISLRSSPVQVGALTNWKQVASNGQTSTMALS